MPDRCRICTANDIDAVVESLAADLWASRMDSAGEGTAWEDAGLFWQARFRELAATAVNSLRDQHEIRPED